MLEDFTIKQLEQELEKRKNIKPLPKETTPDFSTVVRLCVQHINLLPDNSNDFENAIYEAAMEAVYGEKVFDWINLVMDEV